MLVSSWKGGPISLERREGMLPWLKLLAPPRRPSDSRRRSSVWRMLRVNTRRRYGLLLRTSKCLQSLRVLFLRLWRVSRSLLNSSTFWGLMLLMELIALSGNVNLDASSEDKKDEEAAPPSSDVVPKA
ncbi:hypothetical protein LIER_31582 [Lithospermum erythrorhizon]|uniref:Uncharacterized protein n=1 Tax=Lithospermum erythrorhizon TaxID=34254 RepID=A0AAV3RV23_LITER